MELPEKIRTVDELDEALSRPSAALCDAVGQLRSPVVVLGASGKMGPSLCWLLRRAAESAGRDLEIVAASRFSNPATQKWLEARRIRTATVDLLERGSLAPLPDSLNVLYLVGVKFGTADNPALTWAVNTLVPANVAERYPRARLVALSTGNVYPFVPVESGGATEALAPAPVGEYAGAALARERIFQYFANRNGTKLALLRLNYAVELRYGVLRDIAQRVWDGKPLDLAMGYLNCIWQGDANEMILRSFALTSNPPALYNLTGPATLSVRELGREFSQLLERPFPGVGIEAPTALLSNSTRLCRALGLPAMDLRQVMEWIADWVRSGGGSLGKATHFEVRDGQY